MAQSIEGMGRVGIWSGAFDSHPAARMSEAAAELEAMGFRALWIGEAIGRDIVGASAVLLQATSELRVATGIANVYARDAMTTNAVARTLNEAYGGRFVLGLGVSSPALVEKLRKHTYGKPYSFLVEYLEAMEGAMYRAPAPPEEPAVVLAALGPRMLKLAAERTAGAHPYNTPPEHTAFAREQMGPGSWLAPEQAVVLEADPEAARSVARKHLGFYTQAPGYVAMWKRFGFSDDEIGGLEDRFVDAIVAWGDDDAIASRVRDHLDAGADHVCVQVLSTDRDIPVAGWRRVADLFGVGG